jgi:hypothetical protein
MKKERAIFYVYVGDAPKNKAQIIMGDALDELERVFPEIRWVVIGVNKQVEIAVQVF